MTNYTDLRQAAAYFFYVTRAEFTAKSTTGQCDQIRAYTPKILERIRPDLLFNLQRLDGIRTCGVPQAWGLVKDTADPILEVWNLDDEERRTQYPDVRLQAYSDLLRHQAPVTYVEWTCAHGDINHLWISDPESESYFEFCRDILGGYPSGTAQAYITHITFDGEKRLIRDRIPINLPSLLSTHPIALKALFEANP